MIMLSHLKFLGLFAAAVIVIAQDDSDPLEGLSPCAVACIEPAAQLNKCTFEDATCVCSSAQFQADAIACLTAHCTTTDLSDSISLLTEQCGEAGVSPNVAATTTDSIAFTLPASTHSSAATSANAAPTANTTPGAAGTVTTPSGSTSTGSPAPKSAANGLVTKSPVVFLGVAIAAALVL